MKEGYIYFIIQYIILNMIKSEIMDKEHQLVEQKALRVFAMKDTAIDGKVWTLWIDVDVMERNPPAYPIGNRIRYSKEEAIKEASQIAEDFCIPNDVVADIERIETYNREWVNGQREQKI